MVVAVALVIAVAVTGDGAVGNLTSRGGRFELPVAVCALVWTIVALFVLVTPNEAFVSVVIVAGLLLLGGLFFLAMVRFDRQAMETEPGQVDSFTG
ncbi:hypothetical protein [Streptomyces sp. NPDC059761]|uniref:hypothetical protein n=1 Tax=Streptomyces sp. NPDC059761 TaxID=3346937 RepID=UPI003655F1B8